MNISLYLSVQTTSAIAQRAPVAVILQRAVVAARA